MAYIHLACVLLLACLPGCTNVAPAAADPADYVEYTVKSDLRILVSAEGSARIDIPAREGRTPYLRTFLLPVSPEEADLLVRAVGALLEASVAEQINYPSYMGIVLRAHKSGRERSANVLSDPRWHNRIWEGVIDELELVAMLDLARAVNAFADAEAFEARGESEKALEQYHEAFGAINNWESRPNTRYSEGILVNLESVFPFEWYTADGARATIKGLPDRTMMRFPGMTPEVAIKVYRNASPAITSYVVSRSENLFILGDIEELVPMRPEEKFGRKEKKPAFLSPQSTERLKRATWSPPPSPPSPKPGAPTTGRASMAEMLRSR